MRPLLVRRGFDTCGTSCGQYLLSDVLENSIDAKIAFVVYAKGLSPERRAKLEDLKRRGALQVFDVESGTDITAQAVAARAKAAGVHLYAPPGKAFVCASEGYVMVQAQEEGMMPLDFGQAEAVDDAITGATVGTGPRVNVPFRLGETRLFKLRFSPLCADWDFGMMSTLGEIVSLE